jgi:4-hydroxybenzoyl-CoA thioesterase
MPAYETTLKVRFSDIDHAGIVYYPRIFHYFHLAFEEFFGDCAGVNYARVLDEWKLGFPAVHAEVDFRRPFSYGDTVVVEMAFARMGRTSLVTRYRLHKEGDTEICAEGRVTTATIDMDTFKPRALPDRLKEVFARYQAES